MLSQGKTPPSPEGDRDISVTAIGKCYMPLGGTSSSSFLLLGSHPEGLEEMESRSDALGLSCSTASRCSSRYPWTCPAPLQEFPVST